MFNFQISVIPTVSKDLIATIIYRRIRDRVNQCPDRAHLSPYFDFSSRTGLALSIEHVTPYIANNARPKERRSGSAARVRIWLETRSRDLRQQMHPERNQFAFHRELEVDTATNLLPFKETVQRMDKIGSIFFISFTFLQYDRWPLTFYISQYLLLFKFLARNCFVCFNL